MMNEPRKHNNSSSRKSTANAKSSEPTNSTDPFLRPPNEDDDGYDPYSDRIEQPDLYEEDPWK